MRPRMVTSSLAMALGIGVMLISVRADGQQPASSKLTEADTASSKVDASSKNPAFSFKQPEKYVAPARPADPPPMFGDQLQFGGQFGGGQFGGQIGQGGGQFGQFGGQFGGGQFGQFGGQFGFAIAPFRGAYKISENESPRPADRAYVQYNFYSDVSDGGGGGGGVDVHRETIGIEKTLFGDRFSLGLRLPFIEVSGDVADHENEVGDLGVILKYAAYDNEQTGSLLSLGLSVTPPTGGRPNSLALRGDGSVDEIHSTLLQPFVGYIWSRHNFFVQGFTSVMVPTDSDDVTALSNDIGIGYHIDLDGTPFSSVVPMFEVHVNTPLNHGSSDDFPQYHNSVDLTAGCHFFFNERISFGLGVGTTVSNPRLYDIEALANFNVRF